MNGDTRALIIDLLRRIAPEADPTSLDDDTSLQDELDLDSMDMLNLITAISERVGINVPERDYAQMATIGRISRYLAARGVADRA